MPQSNEGPVAVILAAGQGRRMRSERAKVVHEVCGQPMIRYVADAARAAGARKIAVVVGVGAEEVKAVLGNHPDLAYAHQAEPKGTGHAVKAAREALAGYAGPVMVLVGDQPLLRPEPLVELLRVRDQQAAACVLGTSVVEDPTGYGRVVRSADGAFLRIVEEKDATADERAIREVSVSCYVFQAPLLWEALARVTPQNAQGEEYVTDVPAILQAMGQTVLALPVLAPDDTAQVNTRAQLARAGELLQRRILGRLMDHGVTIVDPRNTYIELNVEVGPETVIQPFTAITGRVRIGKNCRIGPFVHLSQDTVIPDGTDVEGFHLGRHG